MLINAEELKDNNNYDKGKILKSIDVLDQIINKKELTNTDVSILIYKIEIKETNEILRYNSPKLDVKIHWNLPFVELKELSEIN